MNRAGVVPSLPAVATAFCTRTPAKCGRRIAGKRQILGEFNVLLGPSTQDLLTELLRTLVILSRLLCSLPLVAPYTQLIIHELLPYTLRYNPLPNLKHTRAISSFASFHRDFRLNIICDLLKHETTARPNISRYLYFLLDD